ncbi:MAG: hypothetical protein D3904_06465, partial [Candidatus Electrothrix sp. EH2]|nr:hypothetical protein [Candidatus Electrothrix sp. EH2]
GFEKGAELTGRDADIGVVDITINNISDRRFRVEPFAESIRHKTQSVKVGLVGKKEEFFTGDAFSGNNFICYLLHDDVLCIWAVSVQMIRVGVFFSVQAGDAKELGDDETACPTSSLSLYFFRRLAARRSKCCRPCHNQSEKKSPCTR